MPIHAPWALEHTPDVSDPQWLIVRTVGFLLLVAVVWKFAVPALASMLAERRRTVAETADQVRDTMHDAETLRDDYQARLEKIEDATEERMAAAVAEATELRDHILREADELAAAVLQRARDEVDHERARTAARLRVEFANSIVGAASHAAARSLTSDDNRRMVSEFVNELEGAA